ncbi:MAG: 50S ribosomal protein L10 [Candidatus Woesearchaeota archaeon]
MKKEGTVPAGWKRESVEQFVSLLKEYPIIGAVNLENLPAKQLQAMRSQLRGKVIILGGKRRLMNIAIEQVKGIKPGIDGLKKHMIGMPALLFTKENPFTLYKTLEKNKSTAPAKAGQTAPKDIIVQKGPTSFAPGPIIGELGQLKIKAGIEGGKVAIKEDAVVVKQGEKVSSKAATILARLGIEPMEIGLDLVAVYEKGTIYTKDILAVDEKEYLIKVKHASQETINLAMRIGYATKETIKLLVSKASKEARSLSLSSVFVTSETLPFIIGKAEAQAVGVKTVAKI